MKFKSFKEKILNLQSSSIKMCEEPGCTQEGKYKAPKARLHSSYQHSEWYWFCLRHVREYNSKWNFFKGMSAEECWNQWNKDITWERPSWPLGRWYTQSTHYKINFSHKDPFGIFNDVSHTHSTQESQQKDKWLILFNLTINFSSAQLQKAYRGLVKKYHPDINGNNPHNIEKIREVNEGYSILKIRLQKIN